MLPRDVERRDMMAALSAEVISPAWLMSRPALKGRSGGRGANRPAGGRPGKPAVLIAAALSVLCLLLAGCSKSTAPTKPVMQAVDGMTITFTTDRTPPHTGDDTVILTVTDSSSGAPIGNANVAATAEALAPRLPGSSVSGRAQGNGRYEIPVRLPVVSSYSVHVTIERTGKSPVEVTFPLDVEQ